jgi:hypothetical protein
LALIVVHAKRVVVFDGNTELAWGTLKASVLSLVKVVGAPRELDALPAPQTKKRVLDLLADLC